METLLITVKDPTKKDFLLALLAELDFVNVKISDGLLPVLSDETEKEISETYSLFDSVGLLEGRDIDADRLRQSAWER